MANPNNNDVRDSQHLVPEKREKRKRDYRHGDTEDPKKAPGRNVKPSRGGGGKPA